jgi:branched-chain amino acid transport system substrate-binding protein
VSTRQAFGRIAGATVIAVLAAAGASSTTAQQPELPIAVNTWLSGSLAVFGVPQATAWQIAADDVNAQGGLTVGDQTYTVVIQADDNKGDPTTTRSVTEKEISDGIKIIKTSGDPTDPVIVPLTEQNGVLLYDNTANYQYASAPYEYSVVTWAAPHLYSKLAFDLYKEETGAESVYGIGVDFQFDHMIMGGAKLGAEQAGMQWIDQTFYQPGTVEFSSVLAPAVGSGADLITFGSPGSDAPAIVTTLRQLGFTGPITSVPLSVSLESIVEGAGENAENVYQSENFSYPYTDALTSLKEKYEAKSGGEWTPFASFYYTEAQFLFEAMKEAGVTDDPTAIIEAMRTTSVPDPFKADESVLAMATDPEFRVLLAPIAINRYKDGELSTARVLPVSEFVPYQEQVIE